MNLVNFAEAKQGDRITHPDVPEQKLIIVGKQLDVVRVERLGKRDPFPSTYYESEFNAVGFSKE